MRFCETNRIGVVLNSYVSGTGGVGCVSGFENLNPVCFSGNRRRIEARYSIVARREEVEGRAINRTLAGLREEFGKLRRDCGGNGGCGSVRRVTFLMVGQDGIWAKPAGVVDFYHGQ
jgi:hypothetical protein